MSCQDLLSLGLVLNTETHLPSSESQETTSKCTHTDRRQLSSVKLHRAAQNRDTLTIRRFSAASQAPSKLARPVHSVQRRTTLYTASNSLISARSSLTPARFQRPRHASRAADAIYSHSGRQTTLSAPVQQGSDERQGISPCLQGLLQTLYSSGFLVHTDKQRLTYLSSNPDLVSQARSPPGAAGASSSI